MNLKATLTTTILMTAALHAAVDFAAEVKPILEFNCVRCHTAKATAVEKGETDYLLDTAKTAVRGKYIIPGDSAKSKVYKTTIAPDDAEELMPPLVEIKKKSSRRLTKEETGTLKTWIDEGAKWPDDIKLQARKQGDSRYPTDTPVLIDEIHKSIVAASKNDELKPYNETITGTDVTFAMVPIPSGKFTIGSPANEKGRKEDEGPQKEIEIAAFWMGKTEVTWDEYLLFMYHDNERKNREGGKIPGAAAPNVKLSDESTHPTQPYVEMSFGMGTNGFPAISMTQHAANKYCQWLSARTGHFHRLPTEAEWEYAARAGTTTAYYWGDEATPAKIGEHEWWGKNADFKYQKVGKKKPNPWGLHDMLGNVIEWTLDQYDPKFYSKMPAANPWNKAAQPYPHVARGGSWDDESPALLRAASRRSSNPEWKRQDPQLPKSYWFHTDAQFLGFRVVRPQKVPTAVEMNAYWNNGVEKDDPRMEKVEK